MNPKWQDFDVVTDRLNDPELINYYEMKRFRYQYYQFIPGFSSNNPDITYPFRTNRGDCVYTTAFTVYCLRKAGYQATAFREPDHSYTILKWGDKNYIMDNGLIIKKGIIPLE